MSETESIVNRPDPWFFEAEGIGRICGAEREGAILGGEGRRRTASKEWE